MFYSGEGVVEMSDEEIMKWMRENYPQYADNIELARALYNRIVKKKRYGRNGSPEEGRILIGEIDTSGIWVRIKGVVVEKKESHYVGCAVCRKKKCKEHHAGTRRYTFTNVLVGDESGMIWCAYPDALDAEVGDEVIVNGRTKIWKNNIEIMANEIEVIMNEEEKERIEDILGFIKSSGRVKEEVIRKMCETARVRFAKLMARDEISLGDEGWIYWVGGDE